jgi:hypothetical protein
MAPIRFEAVYSRLSRALIDAYQILEFGKFKHVKSFGYREQVVHLQHQRSCMRMVVLRALAGNVAGGLKLTAAGRIFISSNTEQ